MARPTLSAPRTKLKGLKRKKKKKKRLQFQRFLTFISHSNYQWMASRARIFGRSDFFRLLRSSLISEELAARVSVGGRSERWMALPTAVPSCSFLNLFFNTQKIWTKTKQKNTERQQQKSINCFIKGAFPKCLLRSGLTASYTRALTPNTKQTHVRACVWVCLALSVEWKQKRKEKKKQQQHRASNWLLRNYI